MLSRIVTGILSQEEKESTLKARNENRFKSSLLAFKSTNGIRPGEFSVIVGQSGNGKSSLCKTISMNCGAGFVKCYHLLSEEKTSVYKSTIASAFEKATGGKSTDKFLENLYFDSMLDWDKKEMNMKTFFEHIENVIHSLAVEMIIFDNFTTSFLGSLPINQQAEAVQELRALASHYDIAIVGVFHTAKGTDIYKKVVNGEDVRGNASSTNGGSYNYILVTHFRADKPRAFLTVEKARYHPEANQKVYELLYDKDLQIYIGDTKSSYENIIQSMDEANKKGKTGQKERSKW